jgi:thioredoxin reductase
MASFPKKIWESNEIIGEELKNIDIKNMKDTYSLQNTDIVDYNVSYVKSLKDIFTDIKDTNDDNKTIKQFVVQDGKLVSIITC